MNPPENLRYAPSHEWIEAEGDIRRVGITDHAQHELSDVVYVELPKLGRVVKAGESVAVVESVKAASDIYAPVSGEIVAVNDALNADPSLVNSSPHSDGWLFQIKPSDAGETGKLLDASAYAALIAG